MENEFYENEHSYRLVNKRKEKKTPKLLLVFICAVVGFASGLGGAALAISLFGNNNITSNDVIYQSVI